ncbi:c-type cytochrome [Propylenella binzhouense]|uniref:Cytochrome c n=1 Tax=Propylenella binzhouense TaxID=2555902 RepID=A0A964WT00_9HYPH|nr:cytochrome c [Propylenella binzhouense]MYZ47493.1 cytochrome c [Propylenella binzhouense]
MRVAIAWAVLLCATSVSVASPIEDGRRFAEKNCGRCHAIGREGDSPLPGAPAFRTLSERYPIESLAEALAEGIVTAHPDMPEFVLEPEEIDALLSYLESIQAR